MSNCSAKKSLSILYYWLNPWVTVLYGLCWFGLCCFFILLFSGFLWNHLEPEFHNIIMEKISVPEHNLEFWLPPFRLVFLPVSNLTNPCIRSGLSNLESNIEPNITENNILFKHVNTPIKTLKKNKTKSTMW